MGLSHWSCKLEELVAAIKPYRLTNRRAELVSALAALFDAFPDEYHSK